MSVKFRRVTARQPCRVCGKPDWCRVSADGRTALCNRVESARPEAGHGGGWVHWLGNTGVQIDAAVRMPATAAIQQKLSRAEVTQIDRQCRDALTSARLNTLTKRLSVSAATLAAFGIGRHAELRAYTLPMRDAAGNIVGVRTHLADDRKRCVLGSEQGLIMPSAVLALLGTPAAPRPTSC